MHDGKTLLAAFVFDLARADGLPTKIFDCRPNENYGVYS